MLNVGAPELLVILVVALIVLGPDKLPDAARQLGKALAEVRKITAGFEAELRDAMHSAAAEPADEDTSREPLLDADPPDRRDPPPPGC